jgi:UDP-glucose 4-epimerase
MTRVAIIGSNGFIGAGLRAHFDKCAVDYLSFSRETPLFTKESKQIIQDQGISDVVFLATELNPIRAEIETDKVDFELRNLEKTLEFLVDVSPGANFVFPSSGGTVYSKSGIGMLETDPANGSNAYGIFKAKCEKIIQSTPLSYLILRISNVYGKGQRIGRGQGVIAEWINAARQNEKALVIGSLEQSRDFIYIDDLSRAFEHAVGRKNVNEVINIGSGITTSLGELIDLIRGVSGASLTVEQRDSRYFDISQISLDIEKAHEVLEWSPSVSISDGIKLIW